ncbi:MAG: biotin/lipoyl-binding protein [Oscillospiraceae bacterium]|nr:biotin/lipoyl-binding protein [Oscillospiraceae bacterium]
MKKPDLKAFWKTKKKLVISVTALVLVAAIGCGIWYYAGHNSAEPVYVYPFNYVGMTEYWGDSQESYGPVTTDKIQTIYLTDTQTVTEILVQAGDAVKKGDLLMSFDTTLNDLALERKRLDVEKVKLRLEDAKDRLRQINSMKPMVIPQVDEEAEEDENLGTALKGNYQISTQKAYDGSTKEKALICWIRSDASLSDDLFEAIRQKAEEFQNANARKEASSASAVAEDTQPQETAPAETQAQETVPPETQPQETEPQATEPEETEPQETQPEESKPEETQPEGTEPEQTQPEETEPEYIDVDSFYVVIKATQGNMSLGGRTLWQGMKVTRTGDNDFSFKFVDITIADHMIPDGDEAEETPEIDYGSGFTAAQIAEMRSEQEKTIKDLEFQVKMAEAEYKIMQTEMDDGNVYAEIDGEVVSVLTEEEARMTMQPILKVSGGGGFYVEGFVSELEKDNMQIGMEVTVNDWNTGMTYTGTVSSLGDFPTNDGYWSGMGNPTASYYPFHVFVDGSADLQEGRYVSVMYSASTAENGVYLQNPFLRTENGQSYVYVLGENGKLEQRFVKTGKSLWGSYTEIVEGLSPEDLVAFPYGKNVKPGVAAVEGDMSNLYG